MRLVDFLIMMLEAHAETLKRLGALSGEAALLEMLEEAGELPQDPSIEAGVQGFIAGRAQAPLIRPKSSGGKSAGTTAYAELEGTVSELNLPAVLEFHLWAYPHYRAFIESAVELDMDISDSIGPLADEALLQAQAWLKRLPVTPAFVQAAEKVTAASWIRFRSRALKKAGLRPIGAL